MRKLVLAMALSLDGFIEGPNKQFVPPAWSGDLDRYWSGDNTDRAGLLLYGRVCFDMNSAFWQGMEANASSPPALRTFAKKMNGLPKIVFSRTLRDPGWNAHAVNDGIAAEIARLKSEPGKDLVMLGGADIATEFMKLGLIDEYRLLLVPIVLGGGTPLFKGGYERFKLALRDVKRLDTGALILSYEPATRAA